MSHAPSSHAPGKHPPTFDTTSRVVAVVIGILAVVAGLVIGFNNPLLRNAGSVEGAAIDRLFSLTLGIATVVFVIVQGFLLYSIVRFGRRAGDDADGPPIHGNTRIEFIWTLVPALTIFFIGFVSYGTLASIERPQPNALVVEVKGFQFAWQFYYPEFDVTAAELHIPTDRQIHLKMRSNDVVHSFWVPEMRIKKDVMPDRVTETFITATEPGAYPIVCTELCGAGHAVMRSSVVVQSDAAFRAWIESQNTTAEAAAAAASDPLAKGRLVFTNAGCNACHVLGDAKAAGVVGPKLDGIGTLAANREPGKSAEEYIHQSIVKPNEYVVEGFPANVMPQDYGQRLSEQDIDALVKYLVEMK